jgi:hypothetical protein
VPDRERRDGSDDLPCLHWIFLSDAWTPLSVRAIRLVARTAVGFDGSCEGVRIASATLEVQRCRMIMNQGCISVKHQTSGRLTHRSEGRVERSDARYTHRNPWYPADREERDGGDLA